MESSSARCSKYTIRRSETHGGSETAAKNRRLKSYSRGPLRKRVELLAPTVPS